MGESCVLTLLPLDLELQNISLEVDPTTTVAQLKVLCTTNC